MICKTYLSRRTSKPIKWHVRPAKSQISLGIRQVCSESLLSAWRNLRSLTTRWAHSEDSDLMPSLICVFAGRTCNFIDFVVRWLISYRHVNVMKLNESNMSRISEFESKLTKIEREAVIDTQSNHCNVNSLAAFGSEISWFSRNSSTQCI